MEVKEMFEVLRRDVRGLRTRIDHLEHRLDKGIDQQAGRLHGGAGLRHVGDSLGTFFAAMVVVAVFATGTFALQLYTLLR